MMRSLSILCPAAGILLAIPVFAGELTPYPPPVQQSVPMIVRPAQIQQPARAPEETYVRFKEEVRSLTPPQRAALARSFEERRAQAARDQDSARELHYYRLLDVLRSYRGVGK